MTDNTARKRAIRALAAAEGLSYTAAMRRYDTEQSERTQRQSAARAGFLQRLMRVAEPAAPLPERQWAIRFEMGADLRLPYPLYVGDGGLIGQQSVWRGEKFQIIGTTDRYDTGDTMSMSWADLTRSTLRSGGTAEDMASAMEAAVGRYPVISDLAGNWSTWDTKIASISYSITSDRATADGTAVVATFSPDADPAISADAGPELGEEPYLNFRIDDLLSALPDEDLVELSADDWVAGPRVSGLLYRAALVRNDPGALKASSWVNAIYDANPTRPDLWDEDEPFRLVIDETAAQHWLEKTHPLLATTVQHAQ